MNIESPFSLLSRPTAKSLVSLNLLLLSACPCCGHGLSGIGLLHPLTGLDHFVAMVAVGAWSTQLGGKALFGIPSCFLIAMLLGGVLGLNHVASPYLDGAIATLVMLLGLAIAIDKHISWLLAGLAVSVFGLSHGLAHGLEIAQSSTVINYVAGFLITTVGLHCIGAVGGLLILEGTDGRLHLRALGLITVVIGIYLLSRLVMN